MVSFIFRTLIASTILLGTAALALAQGQGTLTGRILDPEGLALPGVTVTAESETMLGTRSAVSDGVGNYRLPALTPGMYTLTAQLSGFAPLRRENIQVRTGSNFRVDLQMALGNVEETITVTAESPMIEMKKPGQVITIDGDFQRDVPVQARKNWTDFVELTPGVNSRNWDDGSGRMTFFGHGTEHFHHVMQLEGQIASAYDDSQLPYIQLTTEAIADAEIKTVGASASDPMGNGLIINIITKSGGNTFDGSVATSYQPIDWNSDNTAGKVSYNDDVERFFSQNELPSSAGTPTLQEVKQFDYSVGGPIARDRVWFFHTGRLARNSAEISRTGREVEILEQFAPGDDLFPNVFEGFWPYTKLTAQLSPNHNFSGYHQFDVAHLSSAREYHTVNYNFNKTGGHLLGGKVTSVWSPTLTSDIAVSYNNKRSETSIGTIEALGLSGPRITIHQEALPSSGVLVGSGRILEVGNRTTYGEDPSSMLVIRTDFTLYQGSHEIQTGIFAAPRNRRTSYTEYLNGGHNQEDHYLIDPSDAGSGHLPFRRRIYDTTEIKSREARDRNIAVYLQDAWSPTDRLNITAGLRVDFVNRFDAINSITRMSSTEIGPRLGFSWSVTEDSRNVVRASFSRVHEQVNGRDAVTSFGSSARVGWRDEYDVDFDGVFETVVATPPRAGEVANYEFDPTLHQPVTDEFVAGYRRQFEGELALDVAYVYRNISDGYATTDVNGIYPDGPFQPFGGYGLIDPNRGQLNQLTNNTWMDLRYHALEVVVAKRMSNNWQAMGSVSRQWHSQAGTWNPTDRAGFIQPDAFANTKCLWMPRGLRDDNSYQLGSNSTYCPTWRDYSLRFGATYQAPWDMLLTGSYTHQAGPWSGAIFTRIDEPDPTFGPARVTLANGTTQPNPLADRTRFLFDTRDEGQVKLGDTKRLSVKIGKVIDIMGPNQNIELSLQIFNLLNLGDFQQYTYNGANAIFNPNFLQPRNRQSGRGVQFNAMFRF